MAASKEDRERLAYLRRRREEKTLIWRGGILVTEREAKEIQKEFCAGCGKKKFNPKLYMGEDFCGDCVEKWKHGKK